MKSTPVKREIKKVLFCMHAQEVISTLATRVQHRRKTATQLKSVLCVLQFRSMISVITVQQELRKKVQKGSSNCKFDQKVV
jgi:hypothetical protein